jgi:hypothetical protein
MQDNEYCMVRTLGHPSKTFPRIQQMEQEGWELVSVLPFTVFVTVGYTIIKRRSRTCSSAS